MNDFEFDVERRHQLFLDNPLIKQRSQQITGSRKLIPVHEKIAQIREAIDCYEERVGQLKAELAIYEDEQ